MAQETFTFQTEVGRLLDIVAHSLYAHKEIFLRELIANAADACDRRRFEALTEPQLTEATPITDPHPAGQPRARSTIADNGIGMNREELVENLGTIARSGTLALRRALAGDGSARTSSLIGQFGVGFYSAFMVADRVEVAHPQGRRGGGLALGIRRRRATFTMAPADARRTRHRHRTLHMKPDAEEFLEPCRLRRSCAICRPHRASRSPLGAARQGRAG